MSHHASNARRGFALVAPAQDADLTSPAVQVSDEVCDAILDIERSADDYFHFPWPALDRVVGGMPGGNVCYVGAFSGHGKTTFLASLTDTVFEQHTANVFYMGLESRPKTLRTHWACKRLGYDAGDLITGAYLRGENAHEVRDAVKAELLSQNTGEKFARVRFCGTPYITVPALWQQARVAAEMGATLFVVDHVDHIDGDEGRSAWEQSVQVNRALLDVAHEYGFLMLVATQFNLEATRGHRTALHVAPRPTFVKMGNHKREVATWMLGLYRPLKLTGVPKDVLERYNATGDGYREVIEANTMAVSVMKHRPYGQLEGEKALLEVRHGRVQEFHERDTGPIHGIATTKRSFV